MICNRAFEIARSQADLWPLLKHIIKINLLKKSRETGFTLLCFKHSNGNNPSGQAFAGKCYQTADLLKYQCCDPRCPCIKNSCLLTEVGRNGKSLFGKFDKGSLVNWNCVFDANEFISFCPPLLFRFCTGSYAYTNVLRQYVVGVTKVRFRDKLWRCKKGNRKIIHPFYCCSNMYFDTITLYEWIFTLRLVRGTACWWQVGTELRTACKVFGEIDKLLEG